MNKTAIAALSITIAAGFVSLTSPNTAHAFNMGNIMNPSKWMGGNNRRYDDDYYYNDRYGYGGPGYGYGAPYGAPGYGYGAPYGAPGYGYGAPGYGAPYGGYATPAQPAYSAPAVPSSDSSEQIKALEDRIRQLEANQQPAAPGYGGGYQAPPVQPQSGGGYQTPPGGSYPQPGSAFRPTN